MAVACQIKIAKIKKERNSLQICYIQFTTERGTTRDAIASKKGNLGLDYMCKKFVGNTTFELHKIIVILQGYSVH